MIAIIAARSKNNVIGKDGKIPWSIEGEQSQFRELTTGNAVIMGRKTYEEIGRPLPDRLNILVSKSVGFIGENIITVKSLEEGIKKAGERDVFLAGGYGIFKEGLPLVDKMYITDIDIFVEDGDVFFPEFNADDFDMEVTGTGGGDVKFTRKEYTRKR